MHNDKKWIYEAICKYKNPGPVFEWDNVEKIYKYKNTLYPNKKYTKIYNPNFMKRGDVINFEGNYRNENKMIFDGEKLEHLFTDIDDYGSVPPKYFCGDKDDEFDIGDFEELIVHNSINWLSPEKIKEMEIYEQNSEIKGKINIKGKTWNINFLINEDDEEIVISIKNKIKNKLLSKISFEKIDSNTLNIYL